MPKTFLRFALFVGIVLAALGIIAGTRTVPGLAPGDIRLWSVVLAGLALGLKLDLAKDVPGVLESAALRRLSYIFFMAPAWFIFQATFWVSSRFGSP